MDRQSSFISIWLQLELCAMAVLLTKGTCGLCCVDRPCLLASSKEDKQCFEAIKTRLNLTLSRRLQASAGQLTLAPVFAGKTRHN